MVYLSYRRHYTIPWLDLSRALNRNYLFSAQPEGQRSGALRPWQPSTTGPRIAPCRFSLRPRSGRRSCLISGAQPTARGRPAPSPSPQMERCSRGTARAPSHPPATESARPPVKAPTSPATTAAARRRPCSVTVESPAGPPSPQPGTCGHGRQVGTLDPDC